jgi:hypothetical protein
MQSQISRALGRERVRRLFLVTICITPPQAVTDPPRAHEIDATYVVEGQDGWVAWGRSPSAVANTQAPFAWAISGDNKTILGADMDGYFNITLIAPDRMEKCYTQNGTNPSRSIVAACYEMDRIKH